MARGLETRGCEVTDIGVVPTPVLYYSVFRLKATGAVMITGGDNPPEYRGFKVVSGFEAANAELLSRYREEVEGVVAEAKRAVGAA